MEQRVKRARTDLVTVMSQLTDHPVAVKRCFRCVMQYMEADQAGNELLMFQTHLVKKCRLANFAIEYR